MKQMMLMKQLNVCTYLGSRIMLMRFFCWFLSQALKRGEQFNISGITYSLTQVWSIAYCNLSYCWYCANLILDFSNVLPFLYQGVVKNIVPAIASTNAIVAATCALETLKIATMCSMGMDVYMQYDFVDPFCTLWSELNCLFSNDLIDFSGARSGF